MGVCQAGKVGKILTLEKQYPQFHNTNAPQDFILSYMRENESDMWEHYTKFNQKRVELQKANPELYEEFFDEKKQKDEEFTFSGLKTDDEERFYYFFNKRPYTKVNISESSLIFPRFTFQSYPRFKDDKSLLEDISIISSKIILDEQPFYYANCDNCKKLNLSFDNIEYLPENISKLRNLTHLSLRRNLLKSLPKSFEELRNLVELNLSENKFVSLPKEIFAHPENLVKLNMNSNLLETFEFVGMAEGNKLKFLFLAQNQLQRIPLDIKKFTKIAVVNLDQNLISEIPHNINEEIPYNVEISLHKNKGAIDKIITLKKPKKEENGPRIKGNDSIHTPRNSILSVSGHDVSGDSGSKAAGLPHLLQSTQKEEGLYDDIKIKNPSSQLENEISELINKLIKQKEEKNPDEVQNNKEEILEELYFEVETKLEELIDSGRERELGQIENIQLKSMFKKCYQTYLRKKEFETTGTLNPPLDEMDPLDRKFFLKKVFKKDRDIVEEEEIEKKIKEIQNKSKTKEREDVSNLIFLKQLNQSLSSNKINVYLQYLANIDIEIKKCIVSLWEFNDKNSFILTLTELRLFLQEMLKYYEENKEATNDSLDYEVIKSQAKQVIHNIFYDNTTLRILYRIGLKTRKGIIYNGIEQDKFIFNITEKINKKQIFFEDFLSRFINLVKQTKVDPLDVNK